MVRLDEYVAPALFKRQSLSAFKTFSRIVKMIGLQKVYDIVKNLQLGNCLTKH